MAMGKGEIGFGRGHKARPEAKLVSDKGTLRVVVRWTDAEGGRRKSSRSLGLREDAPRRKVQAAFAAAAAELEAEAEAEIAAGEQLLARSEKFPMSQATLGDVLDEFLGRCEGREVTPTTVEGYRYARRRLRGTEPEGMTIDELDERPYVLEDLYSSLRADGLSDVTVKGTHSFVRAALRDAQRRRLIDVNPIDRVAAPRVRRKPVNALAPDELGRMLATLTAMPPAPVTVAATMAALTGMRRGELCGLRWQDVDMFGRAIRVTHSVSRGADKAWALQEPKTQSSYRTIPIGDSLGRLLSMLMAAQRDACAAARKDWDQGLFVLGDALDGSYLSPDIISTRWCQLARLMDLKGTQGRTPKFHDLRHSFATNAIAQGMDIKTLSSILGHASAAMTLDIYADALEGAKAAAMGAYDSAVSGYATSSPYWQGAPTSLTLPAGWRRA